jgi:hypothetical protein
VHFVVKYATLLRMFFEVHYLSMYLSIYLSIYLSLYSNLLGLGRFLSFLILYTVGRIPWTRDRPIARSLPTHRTTQTHKKHIQTSIPSEVFELTIPSFERAKTVHAIDHAATVISWKFIMLTQK